MKASAGTRLHSSTNLLSRVIRECPEGPKPLQSHQYCNLTVAVVFSVPLLAKRPRQRQTEGSGSVVCVQLPENGGGIQLAGEAQSCECRRRRRRARAPTWRPLVGYGFGCQCRFSLSLTRFPL